MFTCCDRLNLPAENETTIPDLSDEWADSWFHLSSSGDKVDDRIHERNGALVVDRKVYSGARSIRVSNRMGSMKAMTATADLLGTASGWVSGNSINGMTVPSSTVADLSDECRYSPKARSSLSQWQCRTSFCLIAFFVQNDRPLTMTRIELDRSDCVGKCSSLRLKECRG